MFSVRSPTFDHTPSERSKYHCTCGKIRRIFAERHTKKLALNAGEELIWSKVFLGLIDGKFCSRGPACMGNVEEHCILTAGMMVTQERKEEKLREKEARLTLTE